MKITDLRLDKAIEITSETLLGVGGGDYPLSSGNCFSVRSVDGEEYRIVNFNCENLREAIKRGVSWPITIMVMDMDHAVVHDERIPHNWYDSQWCTVCTPQDMLPLNQRLQIDRDYRSGVREDVGSGMVKINYKKRATLEPLDKQSIAENM